MCRNTHDLWTSLTRLLPVGHLPGTAAPSKTLLLFSISSPLILPTNLSVWTFAEHTNHGAHGTELQEP